MTEEVAGAASPLEVARATADFGDPSGDAADQAERLTMIMQAEAVRNALDGTAASGNGFDGEGSLDGLDLPLEDLEEVMAMEDAEDASDDPMHAGGLTPARWVPAEEAAMYVVDPRDPEDATWLDAEDSAERADPDRDQFDGPVGELTPEDETLLGIDPYE